MASGNPFDQFDAPQGQSGVVTVGTPRPPKPQKQIVGGSVVDLTSGTATPIAGLPASQAPGHKQIIKTGDTATIVNLDTGETTPVKLPEPQPADMGEAQAHVSDMLNKIERAKTLIDAPLTSGLAGSLFGHVPGSNAYELRSLIGDPSDEKNVGSIVGDLRQQGIAMLRELNGGGGVASIARTKAEQDALQSAMSNIRQGLSKEALTKSLDDVQQIYLRAYARSQGLDPGNPKVQHDFGINPLWEPARAPGVTPPPASADTQGEQVDRSAPLPTVHMNMQEGVSGSEQAVTDPKLAAIAPQLEKYMNDPKVTDAQILGFMRKNNVDPASTSIMGDLKTRAERIKAGIPINESVDPRYNRKLTGIQAVTAPLVAAEPGGVPVGATLAGAADAATLGTGPDVIGSLPGFTRSGVVNARDTAAGEHPLATLLGNLGGSFLPLPGGAETGAGVRALRTAGSGAAYGFFGSDNPDIRERLFNAGVGGTLAAATHGATDFGLRSVQSGYRTAARPVESFLMGPERTGDKYALNAAARGMPLQNLDEVRAADAAAKAAGVPAPAAATVNRAGQDYLSRVTQGSPSARAIADNAAQSFRAAMPEQLAGDFNAAIESAAPKNVSDYLNRPVREIATDIQDMAGREFERGIATIKGEKMTITPDLGSDLEHERVQGAIRDALANHQLDADTRNELRTLMPQLKTLAGAPDMARQAYAQGIPLSVDGARNIATALDRTAGKMMDGSEGQVELSRLSRDIRNSISEQFPEYAPVNARYASRMRAKEAMFEARRNFFASTPDQKDALAKASRNFTDTPNEAEFGAAPQQSDTGFSITKAPQPLPSNRQLAGVGAREAAQVASGESAAGTAGRIARNVNQRENTARVLGQDAADSVANRAGVRADTADAVDRIASGASTDRSAAWYDVIKRAVTLKATGGAHSGQYMLAHAVAAVPGMSGQDASRVVRIFLDADNSDQAIGALEKAYGHRRARFIIARMAAVTSAASGVRGFAATPPE